MKRIDWFLLGSLFGLIVIGILLVYSATVDEAAKQWQRQILFFSLGGIAVCGITLLPSKVFYIAAYPLYTLSLLLLAYVALFKSGDVERWIALPGGFKLQPSEFAKIALLLTLARFLSLKRTSLSNMKTLIVPFLLFFVPFLLVLKQPDLSTALVFGVMLLFMLYWNGLAGWEIFLLISPLLSVILTSQHFLWAGMFVLLVAVMWVYRVNLIMFLTTVLANMAAGYCSILLWNKILKEHQRDRILTFVNPMRDPKGSGYQIIQSKVTTGSGGLFGKGFGNGSQTNLSFLPEEHTDFIFSVLGEQFGFLGCTVVLLLFFFLIYRIMHTCTDIRSQFANLLIVGITAILGFHVFINVAMTLGMMPVTGLPLPFLSYGGSFILVCMVLVGIVINLRVHQENI
ncbi:MAG: rod shape-determining protein RodA [Fibrobacteria bacterium]|nr:rod shape-determining protein RodA [Fibrobacteria bacterium]